MLSYLNPCIHSVSLLSPGKENVSLNERELCCILYSRSALFTVAMRNENFKFYKNSFLYIPPNTEYSICADAFGDGEAVRILFSLSDDRPRPEDESILDKREVWFADAMHLMEELENLYATWHSGEPFYSELCSAKLKIILLKILSGDIALVRGVTNMRIRHALRYIEAHYAEPITNEEIASSVGLHPYYLSHLVKAECGVSLHRYLLNYRLAVGARMLEGGEDNVENISAQCGFTYCSHFINAFRTLYGMSPKQYARTHSVKK